MKSRVAVISDIHSNADALVYVLNDIKERNIGLTVFLGDILTYGMQPLDVLSLLKRYSNKNRTVFIEGNHDKFYFDIQDGRNDLPYKVADFVEESIRWTLDKIGNENLRDIFEWKSSFMYRGVYFSHANPFQYGDWSHIEEAESIDLAFKELERKKVRLGVFGHSHRQMIMSNRLEIISEAGGVTQLVKDGEKHIVNVGSAGQPRGKGYCYAIFEFGSDSIQVELNEFSCDSESSVSLVKRSNLTNLTKDKLISYIRS